MNARVAVLHGNWPEHTMAGFPIITGLLLMQPLVGLIMGSKSDWPTMEHAADMLLPHLEASRKGS